MTLQNASFLQAAGIQNTPGIQKAAYASGMSEGAYRAAVREHMRGILSGCRVFIRMRYERLANFMEFGVLPVIHEYNNIPDAVLWERRERETELFGMPAPYPVTYAAMFEGQPLSLPLSGYFGKVTLEIRPRPDMTFFFVERRLLDRRYKGEYTDLYGKTAPSLVIDPSENSWPFWCEPYPLKATCTADMPMFIESHLHQRVTRDDVISITFDD